LVNNSKYSNFSVVNATCCCCCDPVKRVLQFTIKFMLKKKELKIRCILSESHILWTCSAVSSMTSLKAFLALSREIIVWVDKIQCTFEICWHLCSFSIVVTKFYERLLKNIGIKRKTTPVSLMQRNCYSWWVRHSLYSCHLTAFASLQFL